MGTELLANLVIERVCSVSTLYSPKNKRVKKTNRSRWAIVLKYEGETVYTFNGNRYLSDLNHLIVLPKGSDYEWECTHEGHFSIVEFEAQAGLNVPTSFAVKNGDKILKMIKDLEYKRNLKKAMIEPESIRDVYSILLMLTQPESEPYLPSEKQQKIAPAIDYISRHYHESITNDTLAQVVGVSTVYFRKLFTSVMGESPIAYLHKIRIEKAKEMLNSDYGTLTDIAQTLGYPSLYDFSRAFKKHTGVAPSWYENKKESI